MAVRERRHRKWLIGFVSVNAAAVVLVVLLFAVAIFGVLGSGAMGQQPSSASACGAGATPAAAGAIVQVTGTLPTLTAEQQHNAQVIAGVALARGLGQPGLLVGIVTALTESTLINVNHGDIMGPSSIGLFQQMPGWGPLSVRTDPAGSAGLFYDALLKLNPVWTSQPVQMQAQNVEKSEFSDGSNYLKNLPAATAITSALMAGPPATPAAPVTGPATTGCPSGAAPAPGGPGQVVAPCTSGQDRTALVAQVLASPNLLLRAGREASQTSDIQTGLECNAVAVIASMETLGVQVRLNSLKSDHPIDGGYHPKGMAMDLGYPAGDPVGATVYEFLYRNYLALNVIQIIWAYPPTITGIDPGKKCIQQDTNGVAATHGVLGDCDALYPSDISGHTDHLHLAVHL